MPQLVDVEGIGKVEYGDDFTPEEILAHINSMGRAKPQPLTPAPQPGGVQLLDNTAAKASLAAQPQFRPEPVGLGTRILAGAYNPVLSVASIPHAIEQAGAAAMNLPFYAGRAMGLVPRTVPQARITPDTISQVQLPVPPPFAADQPLAQLAYQPNQLQPEPPEGVALANKALGMVTPGVALASVGAGLAGAPHAVGGLYAPQMAAAVPGQVAQAVTTMQDPSLPMRERAGALAEPIATAAMAALATHGTAQGVREGAMAPELRQMHKNALAEQQYRGEPPVSKEEVQLADLQKAVEELNTTLQAQQITPTTETPEAGRMPVRAYGAGPKKPTPLGLQNMLENLRNVIGRPTGLPENPRRLQSTPPPVAGAPALPHGQPSAQEQTELLAEQNDEPLSRSPAPVPPTTVVQSTATPLEAPKAPSFPLPTEGPGESPAMTPPVAPPSAKALRYGDVVKEGTTHTLAGMQLLDELRAKGVEYDPAKLERGDVVGGQFVPETPEKISPTVPPPTPPVPKAKEPTTSASVPFLGQPLMEKASSVPLPPTMEELAQKAASPTGRFTKAEGELLDEVRAREPETHKAYLKRVGELRGTTKKPFTAQLPLTGPAIATEGPRLMDDPSRMGMRVGQDHRPDPVQLLNRLQNMANTGKLGKGEWATYEKAGIAEFLAKRPTVGEVGAWMRENGPRVEVVKKGEGMVTEEMQEHAQLRHWLDLQPASIQQTFRNIRQNDTPPPEWFYHDMLMDRGQENMVNFRRLLELELDSHQNLIGPRSSAHWSSIAPKAEGDMKGYVEGAVVVPLRKGSEKVTNLRPYTPAGEEAGILHPSTHSFPPNTLGFWRGYIEHGPKGEKTFHVVEVQSDWGQRVREDLEKTKKFAKEKGMTDAEIEQSIKERQASGEDAPIHPLLADHQRLVLKAAIEHAVKEGADRIAVSDAETAMMSEGHDLLAGDRDLIYQADSAEQAKAMAQKDHPEAKIVEVIKDQDRADVYNKYTVHVKDMQPDQSAGMRLNYDRILPSILAELTGDKGESVDFGEHVKAFGERDLNRIAQGGSTVPERQPRSNLIFKNPDGSFQTTIKARSYDLSRVKAQEGPFSLTGKDRLSQAAKAGAPLSERVQLANGEYTIARENTPAKFEDRYGRVSLLTKEPAVGTLDYKKQEAFPWRVTTFDSDKKPTGHETFKTWKEAYASVLDEQVGKQDPAGVKKETPWSQGAFAPVSFDDIHEGRADVSLGDMSSVDALGLRDGGTAHDALRALATQPQRFGNEYAALADFYTRHFEPALRTTTLDPSGGDLGRTHFLADPSDPRIYLSLADSEHNVAYKLLHEASHAALWWRLEHAKTPEHLAAKGVLQGLRDEMTKQLTTEEQRFLKDVYRPYIEKTMAEHVPLNGDKVGALFDQHGISRAREGVLYPLTSDLEFTGALGLNKTFMGMLRAIGEGTRSGLGRFVDAVKTLLGIKKKTGADTAFDALMQLSQDAPEDFGGGDAKAPVKGTQRRIGAPQAPIPGPALVNDMTREESLRHKAAYFLGKSAPRHLAVGEGLGNKLVGYASSRITAPLVARSMATDVLGDRWKDDKFSHVLGAVLVEDQLRQVRKGFQDAALKAKDPVERQELLDKAQSVNTLVGQPYAPFKTEALYQGALNNADIKAAIDRHKETIQPMAEQAHTELGGTKAKGGEATDAFANLIAILAPDDVESTRKMVYGSRRGDITNQLRRGSAFSKERRGTAAMYETDYRTMAERMIRGNWEQKALRDYIKAVEHYGVGVEQKAGEPAPTTLKGKKLVPQTIELRGAGPGQTRHIKLWMRPDLTEEWEQATQKDSKVHKAAVGYALDVISDLQMAGPTDAVWHGGNMLASIATSPGGFKNPALDLLRRVPIVNVLDALVRATKGTVEAHMASPEVQRELAQIGRVGAARSPAVHSSFIGKLAERTLGTPKADPSYWVGKIINSFDQGGRLARNRMFDNLVDRGWAVDSEVNRREFINKMGQYNRRLMSQFQNIVRDYQVAPFVVAGRNFNRLAFQKLVMQSPGYEATSLPAAGKARLHEIAGNAMALAAFPVVANMLLTKTLWGRPGKGVPVGMVDSGKEDKDGRAIVWDPLQLLLLRRGMRELGLPEIDKGVRQGLSTKETGQNMIKTAFNALAHPWLGPVAKFVTTAKTGRDTSGFLLSRNPDDLTENIQAAMSQLNPSYAAFTKVGSTGEAGGLAGVATQLGGAAGFKKGYFPTAKERMDAEVAKLGHEPSLGERLVLTKKIQDQREPNTDVLSKRDASQKVLWRDFARQDRMMDALTPESQKWLAQNKLSFQGFQNEITSHKIRMPVTGADAARMEKVFVTWYQKAIDQVQGMDGFAQMDQQTKQRVLDKVLDRYRGAARKTWLAIEASRSAPATP